MNLYVTVEISDQQRLDLANVLDGKVNKRQATRDEIKEFVWKSGKSWELLLNDLIAKMVAPAEYEADDDLLGLLAAGNEDEDLI